MSAAHAAALHGPPLAAARPYAERAEQPAAWHDELAEKLFSATLGPLRQRWAGSAQQLRRIVDLADVHEAALRLCSDAQLRQQALPLRAGLRRHGYTPALAAHCFALVREAAARTLGQRHYPSQLMAGFAMLRGRLVEMATGEGKTFAATLPACAVALAGRPVHVVTVNDYLARRDAQEMAPLYAFFGLAVGTVVQGLARPERRAAYARDITYCTNKELAFDYLRDRVSRAGRGSALQLALQRLGEAGAGDDALVLRGLHFAIVDEADSVFIDEARTPLILSTPGRHVAPPELCARALALAGELVAGQHYVLDGLHRSVRLLDAGRERIAAGAPARPGDDALWSSPRARDELLTQALSALLLYRRDQHYVLTEGKVQIVDESTGRVMPDRSWERGLHQLIEAKEGVDLTQRRDTLARLTYQRLFRRYLHLAGMSGTAIEVAAEIRVVYRLDVLKIPLHKPSRRLRAPDTLCATQAQKWQRVADTAQRLQASGRPVLIGTRSVAASERLSAVLAQRGVAHALLNAKQDQAEAEVIAAAGQPGRVTVATNMAGRGTDIRLGEGVAASGGLHVILTEFHDSRRTDRQLFGRCARQSDPGSCEAIISLEDEIFTLAAPRATAALRRALLSRGHLPAAAHHALLLLAQHSAEARHAQERTRNIKLDQRLQQALAFSGRAE
jgi:preprotein translocase subunit SecA